MTTCRTFVAFLLDYAAGDLPAAQRREFERHLAACIACVRFMQTYLRTIQLGKGAFADPQGSLPAYVPEELVAAVLHARAEDGRSPAPD